MFVPTMRSKRSEAARLRRCRTIFRSTEHHVRTDPHRSRSWRRALGRALRGAPSGALVRTRRKERGERGGAFRARSAPFCPYVREARLRARLGAAQSRRPRCRPHGAAPPRTRRPRWVPRVRYRDPRRNGPRERSFASGRALGCGRGPARRGHDFWLRSWRRGGGEGGGCASRGTHPDAPARTR
jgi:hypothetical protein